MKKLLLILVLAFTSSSVMAELVEIVRTPETVYYADPTSLRVKGNRVRVLVLEDYVKNHDHYRSQTMIDEFNCLKDEHRSYSYFSYSNNMGKGESKVVDFGRFLEIVGEWSETKPGSIMDHIKDYACNKANMGFLPLK